MHARDAEEATRRRRTPLDPELVVDGIDEILTMFLPRQVRLGRLDPPAKIVELVPVDADGGPFRLAPAGDGEVVGVVRAPAETLLLLLWRRERVDAPGIEVDGDLDRVRSLFALPLTP
jgi:hypothetical protein